VAERGAGEEFEDELEPPHAARKTMLAPAATYLMALIRLPIVVSKSFVDVTVSPPEPFLSI
jgi:hypothetical protein